MKKRFERRTSWKVVITYLFIIAFCGAMFYYIYKIQGSIQNQKVNISVQNRALDLTNHFTQLVHEAQSEANLFAFTDNAKHLKRFGEINNEINHYADSLLDIMPSKENEHRIREVERLILRKGQISYVLSRQFSYFDPFAEIDAKLQSYIPKQGSSTTITSITQSDTIIHNQERKSLWKRIGEVFSPSEADSIVQVSNQTVDTTLMVQNDSIDILEDLKQLSEKARTEYKQRIKEYEKKTAELITDDNHLSEEIAELLLALNKEILDSSIVEIENSESLIKENSRSSTIIAATVLVLIIVFIILILSDVSKGFRARQAAEKAQAIAEEAQRKTEEIMETRHKMLLSVSHDIKTPLSSIMGNLELMDNTGNEKEVHSIQQSADHILSLLSNLLEFSSLEQGKLHVENTEFNVSALCEEAASMFEPIARKKNLDFNFKNELRANLYANADPLKIKQIIINLISNAIKYTIEGHIGFRSSLENGCLVFRIQDTGIGIPDDKLEEIFKPFVRTESGSKLSEGSGYGLSVVKGLVDLMEGTIEVESELGKGSMFTVRIPTTVEVLEEGFQNKSTDLPIDETEQTVSSIAAPAPQRHILVIDDDDTLLTVTSNMIGKLGHDVFICRSKNDLDEALKQLETYDYILTDREMGALTGNDILKLFKKVDRSKPVYLMTARMDYTMEIAKKEGFDGFLQKPFNLKALENLFGRHSQNDQPASPSATAETSGSIFSDFPELCTMMGDDADAVRDILTVFAQSTADNLVAMNEAVEHDDFVSAQALSHKMLPMFIELQQEQATPFLSKMNALRSKKKDARQYPEWKDDAIHFMTLADQLLELLSEKYEIG